MNDTDLMTQYDDLYHLMVVPTEKSTAITAIAQRIINNKARYQAVAAQTGVPWALIAAIHYREGDLDWDTYLGNGEPLSRKTKLVPAGRGPFASWEEGAIDALKYDGLHLVKKWTMAQIAYAAEHLNGFGYRLHHPSVKSPYLWSFSNLYTRGKYASDGKFDPQLVDKQCGVMPLVQRLMDFDETARLASEPSLTTPAIITSTGGFLGIAAHALGASPGLVIGIFIGGIIAAIIIYELAKSHSD